jgi:selenocysteine lyase/cysteine desulfurase
MLMRAGMDLGALRVREFARLDATLCAYLDFAGAALYPRSLVVRDARRLATSVMGNPHSESGPSRLATVALEEARTLTLEMLDADSHHYDVIFTANASGGMRIVAESFPFRSGSRLVLTADNHNSVNGIRVRARRRGATVDYVPLDDDLRACDPYPCLPATALPSLFAFPAQSNFSGVKHPLGWVRAAQARGYRVLLDAAAYLPTNRLSLTETPADFVALSFYKIFGYPTGVGALVVRRDAMPLLGRTYFGGGTVQYVSVQNRRARLHDGAARFEDGTPSFLAMPAVCDGLRWFEHIGVERIGEHVERLTASLLDRLASLGNQVIVYGPRKMDARGGTIAFNLIHHDRVVEYESIEQAARERDIAIRGGCFCNPGAAEHAFGIDGARALACLKGPFTIARFRRCLRDSPVGALRASIGLATNEGDLDRLMSLLTDLASVDFQRHDRIDPAGAPGGGNDASSATATSTAATVA